MPFPEEGKKYTYADLIAVPEAERYELIEGVPRRLTSPSDSHQAALTELIAQFRTYLRGKMCFVRPAPYDVMLFAPRGTPPEDIDTVLQPDMVVICDSSKRTMRGCMGAPDLVIEVLSPSSVPYDRDIKLDLYEAAGVREYWLVDAKRKKLEVFLSENGAFRHREVYYGPAKVPVSVLKDLVIDMEAVYDMEL